MTKKKNLNEYFKNAQQQLDHDPSMVFDNRGRLLRWVKIKNKRIKEVKNCCGNSKLSENEHNIVFIDKLEAFQRQLYNELEVRRRAISNWKFLRTRLLMVKIWSGKDFMVKQATANKYKDFHTTLLQSKQEVEEKGSWKETIAPYVINPMN